MPRLLPAASAHFAGRAWELKALNELLGQAMGADGRGVIWVIDGTAGVGKTALAVYWAHQVADEFPDGQLYVNLRGFGPSGRPVAPEEAIRGLLSALHVPSARIPETLDAQAALYRSTLAGKRMLILLDNARDESQVRPLLPGSAACPVLITSRSELTGLVAAEGAHPLSLDVLSEEDACEVLTRQLGTRRVAAEPEAARALGRLCAGLPLALAVAAARADARPGLPLAALAAELHSARGRLDALETGDAASSVREVLSWSYRQLSSTGSRMFRLLGVHPGPDISVPAAASLLGAGVPEARGALAELTRAHLLTQPAPGRFGCHDVLRAYAAEQAQAGGGAAEGSAAIHRVLDHYLHTAHAAAQLLYPHREVLSLPALQPGAIQESLSSPAQAQAWFEAEHEVLLALTQLGSHREALACSREALAVFRETGHRGGEAAAWDSVGFASHHLGQHREALACYNRALGLHRALGDRYHLSRTLVYLGEVHDATGNGPAAERAWLQALAILEELHHPEADQVRSLLDDLAAPPRQRRVAHAGP